MSHSGTMSIPRALVITMRPYLLFVSGITGLAGLALAGPVPYIVAVPVFLAAFLSYGFGQVLTDCFQTDTDALSAPYRPLTYGAVKRSTMMVVSIAGLIFCAAVFTISHPLNAVFGAAAVLGLATYTPFKRRWWGGPFYNALIVAILAIICYRAGIGTSGAPFPAAGYPLIATVLFGYANFVLSGYFKDIAADAATGYNTFPVVFGRKAAALASDGLAALEVAGFCITTMVVLRGVPTGPRLLAGALAGLAGITLAVRAQVLLHRNRDDRTAHKPIGLVVQSYILLLSGLICLMMPEWTAAVIVHDFVFLAVFHNRPEICQI